MPKVTTRFSTQHAVASCPPAIPERAPSLSEHSLPADWSHLPRGGDRSPAPGATRLMTPPLRTSRKEVVGVRRTLRVVFVVGDCRAVIAGDDIVRKCEHGVGSIYHM